MLLSDRDIRQEVLSGRVSLDPWDAEMVQPSSVDVRLDRYFRLFDNHKYPYIDPAVEQPDLTRLIEVRPDEPFVLHPGEFALGSTFEQVRLPDDIAARWRVSHRSVGSDYSPTPRRASLTRASLAM